MKRPVSKGQKELLEKMLGEISKKETGAASFRMWNTLVLTPFSSENDLFVFMEDDFRRFYSGKKTFTEMRIQAQENAVKKCGKSGAVTVGMIYDILAKLCKLDKNAENALIQRECELIESFVFPRQCGKELFRAAKDSRKKTVILADSIYPRNVIVNILSKCGYETCDEVVIPQEIGIPDVDSENAFNAALKRSGVQPSKLVHIGGDVEKDVEIPILKGVKALLLSPVIPLMVKSGRFRGYVQSRKLLDYESAEHIVLRCIFGLYSAYGFDIPQNKQPHSDFCNDKYMIGFIILGSLSLDKDFSPETDIQRELVYALESDGKIIDGRNDFIAMFSEYFGDLTEKYGCEGCRLPLVFLENHAAPGDRGMLKSGLSDIISDEWAKNVTEPDILPVYAHEFKKNALSRLADKLFPPGTKVRTITDKIMAKMHL